MPVVTQLDGILEVLQNLKSRTRLQLVPLRPNVSSEVLEAVRWSPDNLGEYIHGNLVKQQ